MINKKAVITGIVVSLACSYGGYKLHKDNPYIEKEIIPRITNESLVPESISEVYNETMDVFKENFPKYKDLFDNRIKDVFIHLDSINKYTNEPMSGSVYVQKKDQILILPSRMKEDLPHEMLHVLTDKESTGVCGFKKKDSRGKAINEGFATLVHSELFLEEPKDIEDDTLYNVELASTRIITSMVGKEKMIKYFFEEEYSVDDITNELGNVLKDKELSKEYIDTLDEYNGLLTDYALMYTRYKTNPDMYKEETITLSQKLAKSLEKVQSLSYKVMTKYLTLNDVNKSYIVWFNDQIDYMQDKFSVETHDENYIKYIELIDSLSFDSSYEIYDYLGLINEEKTNYFYSNKK